MSATTPIATGHKTTCCHQAHPWADPDAPRNTASGRHPAQPFRFHHAHCSAADPGGACVLSHLPACSHIGGCWGPDTPQCGGVPIVGQPVAQSWSSSRLGMVPAGLAPHVGCCGPMANTLSALAFDMWDDVPADSKALSLLSSRQNEVEVGCHLLS